MAQRGVEGAGAPPGLDTDAARAVEWLALIGLPGVAALVADLDAGLAAPDACRPTRIADGELRFVRASGLLVGAMVVEWAAIGTPLRRRVEGLVSPLGLLPEAEGRARECGGLAVALLGEGSASEAAGHFPADGSTPALAGNWARSDGTPRRLSIAVGAEAAKLFTATSTGLGRISDIATTRHEHLRAGIEIDDALWRRLSAHAARILVPPSAISRARGAGSSAVDDND